MSRWSGRDESCETCGLVYENFRTGYTFKTVREMLWVGDSDYSKWKYKRRHTVLGLWHQIKKSMWREHQRECELAFEYVEQQKAKEMMEGPYQELDELLMPLHHFEEVYNDEVPF